MTALLLSLKIIALGYFLNHISTSTSWTTIQG